MLHRDLSARAPPGPRARQPAVVAPVAPVAPSVTGRPNGPSPWPPGFAPGSSGSFRGSFRGWFGHPTPERVIAVAPGLAVGSFRLVPWLVRSPHARTGHRHGLRVRAGLVPARSVAGSVTPRPNGSSARALGSASGRSGSFRGWFGHPTPERVIGAHTDTRRSRQSITIPLARGDRPARSAARTSRPSSGKLTRRASRCSLRCRRFACVPATRRTTITTPPSRHFSAILRSRACRSTRRISASTPMTIASIRH